MTRPGPGADGPDRLAAELRALALVALDRLDPLLARLRAVLEETAPGEPACPPSTGGGHPADHVAALVAALRDALAGAPGADPEESGPRAEPRPVQAIPVERGPVDGPSAGGAPPC